MVYTTISFVCYFLGNKDSSNSCSYNLNLSTFSCFYFSFVYLTSRPKQITIVLTKLLLHLSEENLLISELGGHTRQHLPQSANKSSLVTLTLKIVTSLHFDCKGQTFNFYSVSHKEYILVIERIALLRLPNMCLTQPLPALSVVYIQRVHHSSYLTV